MLIDPAWTDEDGERLLRLVDEYARRARRRALRLMAGCLTLLIGAVLIVRGFPEWR